MYLETDLICLDLSVAKEQATSAFDVAALDVGVFDVGARTDSGRVRENNEDSLLTVPETGLFVLSDGMGGLAHGEVASQLTVSTIIAHCQEADSDPRLPLTGEPLQGFSAASNRLISAIQLANRAVYSAARESTMPGEMGATIVAVRCQKGRMSIAHVGDSRVYRLRSKGLRQLTRDHSLAAEQSRLGHTGAEEQICGAYQNLLTRAVGIAMEVAVDITEEALWIGDTLLLCSDGLTRELSDKQIAAILSESKNAQTAADRLVDLANQAGGGDNITAVVVRPLPPAGESSRGRWHRWLLGSNLSPEER